MVVSDVFYGASTLWGGAGEVTGAFREGFGRISEGFGRVSERFGEGFGRFFDMHTLVALLGGCTFGATRATAQNVSCSVVPGALLVC